MTNTLHIDEDKTAVLIMDYQNDILLSVENQRAELVLRAADFLKQARIRKLKVIYVCVGFREAYPEVDVQNIMFATIKKNQKLVIGTQGADIHADIKPQKNEIVIVKRRVNAFYGTDLEINLRASGIDTLVMFGVSTGGVVLSTLREAADRDYRCIIIKDLCADKDESVHECLTEKVFVRQASVIAADDF